MTVIDYATGEVAHLTEAEARRLTERIRTALDRVSSAWADLAERVAEAYQRRADLALGYGSWAASPTTCTCSPARTWLVASGAPSAPSTSSARPASWRP